MDSQTAQPTPQPEVQKAPKPSGSKTPVVILIVILLVVVLAGAGFFLLKNKEAEDTGPKVVTDLEVDSVTIGLVGPVTGVFPESAPEFHDVVFNNHIFEGLGRIENGQVRPALATSWSNPDNTTWRFNLRKGVKFHNGDSFTASDVKFSIDTAIAKEWPNDFNLSTVKSVEVVDDSTLDIKTIGSDPVLLNRLVFAFVVSEKQYKARGENPAVGTGPYKYKSLDKEGAILEANEGHYSGTPKVNKVVYKFFPADTKDSVLVEALKKSEVDLISTDDESLTKDLGGTLQVKSLEEPFISLLVLDTIREKSPGISVTPNPLSNKLVRQAINKAINVSNVAKEASLSAVPSSQYVTDAIFGYNPNITRPTPNVEEAKDLMKQAGVPDGFNLTIDIFAGEEKVANAIKVDLQKINIKVKIVPLESDELFGKVLDQQGSSALILSYGAETYDAGEIFTDLLHTQEGVYGANQLLGYSNTEIDKLAEEIATTFDLKVRQTKLQEAMVKAMEELPMVPMFSKEFFFAFSEDIEWTPTAFGAIYANEISGRQVTNQ